VTPEPEAADGRLAAGAPTDRPATPEDRPLTRGERSLYQVARLLLTVLAGAFWRIRVEGRENIPRTGPFVLAPVHRSNIDTVLMPFVTRRQMRYMAKDSLWKHGWSARLLTALGGFPVNRETADRESLRTCESALQRGEGVVIFPEGTRKTGATVTNLFEGAAFVAVRNGVPIVPVGIGGSDRAMPRGAKYLRPVKIRIVIGSPIVPPARGEAGTRGRRRQVHELTARLQVELQALFDKARAWAG
jgi:1-acyl-sn-glycerol-3-phosphate acyltransferase